MENNIIFENIISELNLGAFTAPPQRVKGGYMHKMYKLKTTTGTYAVKLLNPAIMRRPDALGNYQRAERLERVLQENQILVVPAIEINGKKMQCVAEQYFYVFPWVEGKALDWQEITDEHCKIAGALLAKIHKIEQIKEPFAGEKICVDWDEYIVLANERCPEIAEEIKSNRDLLYLAQREFNQASENLPPVRCICDGDMDSKNVLWLDGNPLIIDLESLDYGNPFLEMFQLALSWAGGVLCDIDCGRFYAFINAYRQEYGEFEVDWQALSGVGFGWLDWLEYNIKRALMMECENEEERQLGIGQVHETIQRIIYYNSVREELVKKLTCANNS